MAVKNNLYDALDYAGQVEETTTNKKPTFGEFLSGFWKEDRLIPSVTVTIYFGADKWDGPLSLFDMMQPTDPRILSNMDNYHVHLIAPGLMSDEKIMKFQTNFGEVMLFIKYSKDKEKLQEILKLNEERFRKVERRAAEVIEIITKTGLKYQEMEGEVDMCQAIQEMRKEEHDIGKQEGRQKEKQNVARNLYKMGMEIEKIAQAINCDEKVVKQWLGLLN